MGEAKRRKMTDRSKARPDEQSMRPEDKAIERLIRKRWPGAQIGWMTFDGGPPRRAARFRVDVPFPSRTQELIGPDGSRYSIHMVCDKGLMFMTWGHVADGADAWSPRL
jgi:hypothetical protein